MEIMKANARRVDDGSLRTYVLFMSYLSNTECTGPSKKEEGTRLHEILITIITCNI